MAPADSTIKELFPRDVQQGDYHTLAAVDLYADRRYDIYWDEKGGVRRRGDDATPGRLREVVTLFVQWSFFCS